MFTSRDEVERILGRAVVAEIIGGAAMPDAARYFDAHIGK